MLGRSLAAQIEQDGGRLKLGKRRLAYLVKKFREGSYVLFTAQADGAIVREVERRLRVMDLVIKYLTVRMDDDMKRLEKIKAHRQKRATHRSRARNEGGERPRGRPRGRPYGWVRAGMRERLIRLAARYPHRFLHRIITVRVRIECHLLSECFPNQRYHRLRPPLWPHRLDIRGHEHEPADFDLDGVGIAFGDIPFDQVQGFLDGLFTVFSRLVFIKCSFITTQDWE